ncbi:MAG: hypothetical protein BRC30_00715 [Nanohaloarchaea archaeon SW_7_46_7]|nr:MAG: hypothetical protein BRC30_00715 [Nanohaloarchaea archaeon SW_7_46_7]
MKNTANINSGSRLKKVHCELTHLHSDKQRGDKDKMKLEELDKRSIILGFSSILLVGFLIYGASQNAEPQSNVNAPEWRNLQLEDANTGDEFTISELEKPLLVETFAVWCPTCTNQQNKIKQLKQDSNITSVSLDVDSNEDKEQIRRHTEENGFDWRYAISPPELTLMLTQKFGNSIANPPSAPVVLVCEEGSRKLPNGVKTASTLQQEIEEGC